MIHTLKEFRQLDELKDLLPPLSEEEFAGLEASILAHGCISPVVMWDDVIVDGHNRFKICEKHQIPIKTKTLPFDSLDDAKLWAWQHQEHRRNLTPYQRTEIALKFKDAIRAQARKNMSLGGSKPKTQQEGMSTLTPLPETNTRNELAKIANVSTGTISKAEYLQNHADAATKAKLRTGETTINKEYNRVKRELKCEEIPVETDPETGTVLRTQTVYRVDLRNIRRDDPESLIMPLMETFTQEYRERLILDLLAKIEERDGTNVVTVLVEKITSLYPTSTERSHPS